MLGIVTIKDLIGVYIAGVLTPFAIGFIFLLIDVNKKTKP